MNRVLKIYSCFFIICIILHVLLVGCSAEMSGKDQNVYKTDVVKKIPVILDTDIGDDIDDMWALAFMLKSPEFDIKLITTATGDTSFRAELVAKTLEIFGRTDIPIGIGKKIEGGFEPYYQRSWMKSYDISKYPGKIYKDGVGVMIDTIMKSDKRIKVIAIGPLPNLADAIIREPEIAKRSEIIGMQGSVYRGYDNSPKPVPEYNVRMFVKDSQIVFNSSWPMTITPLDTCGVVRLQGEDYKKVLNCSSPYAQAVIDAYRAWVDRPGYPKNKRLNPDKQSTVLFDTVAVYLAMSEDMLKMKNIGISVDDEGSTVVDEHAKKINCAVEWKDLQRFKDLLVSRLTN